MFERTFRVKYITSKDCFVYLSDKHSKSVNQGNVVKLSSARNEPLYVSVGSHLTTLKEEEIAIGSMCARSLGICEGGDAVISLCNNLPAIKRLDVIPETNDDFEVLESMAEIVQQTLLDQIRIVNNNQKVLIWISNSLHVVVNVDNIEPAAPGRLEEFTEVVLKSPPVKQTEKSSSNSSPWRMNGFWKYFGFDETPKSQLLDRFGKLHTPLVFRLQPVDDVKSKIPHFNAMAFFKVYVDAKSLPTNYFKSELFSLRVIPLLVEQNFFDETNPLPESIAVQVCPIENLVPEHGVNCIPLFANKSLFKHYNVNVGTKVILDKFNEATVISSIEIGASQQALSEVQRTFKEYVAENCKSEKLLLNSNFALALSDDCEVKLKFAPSNVKACLVDSDFVRNCEFASFECDFLGNTAESVPPNTFCANFCNFESILRDCMRCWEINSTGCDGELQNILIVGKPGTGKTTLANHFAVSISSYHHVHVEPVTCKNVKGKSLDSLHKLFTNTFAKLIYYQPSMLVLDDLHVICEKVADGDAPTQESIYFNKVSDLLADMLTPLLRNNFISVMATAETTIKLNQGVFSSRGKHFFKNVFSIDELNTGDRRTFIEFAFSQRMAELDCVDLQDLAAKTEGFVAQDIVDLVDKCVFEAYKEESLKLTSSHCEKGLLKTSSLSLRNVRLHSAGDRDFSNIGGLDDVKRTLVECMLWPAQYTNIFGKAPLRLQTGILLYGPPGTGKTILAGAAAKQCGLRLISVKGPELLSKYIGASEQAVRDVFQKAQSAKPCILFFDEFDSLAPRRGHDNTGVTDRVVNQFLTQLDGVEALIGVCVLAATSRPDLLDPALLRPGRLDRQIFCPLPDKEARLAILERLSSMLSLTDDVDLVEIAGETEGFSGADLQGVLYTAQLASVEHLLDEYAAELESQARINQGHLIEAVRNGRPSLTNQEKIKYERIYAKFQGRGQLTEIMTGKQRATLV